MNCFKELRKNDFYGVDVSLETSLNEYGLVGKDVEDGILCIYPVKYNSDNEPIEYNAVEMSYDFIDTIKDSSWRYNFEDYIGDTLDKETKITLNLIHDLISYIGTEDVFGTCYYSYSLEELINIVVED